MRGIQHRRNKQPVGHLPQVVEADLGLVVEVGALIKRFLTLINFITAAIERVAVESSPVGIVLEAPVTVLIQLAFGHPKLAGLGVGIRTHRVQGKGALPVGLGRAQTRERQTVLANSLAYGAEVRPSIVKGLVNPAVLSAARTVSRHGPVALQLPRAEHERIFPVVVGAAFHPGQHRFLVVEAFGEHVDGAAHRGHGNLRGRQAALHLERLSHIAKVPVRPEHVAVFHVVHRHPVDEHGHVALVEAAHVDARVAGAAAALGGIYAGCFVENHRQVAVRKSFAQLHFVHNREGHGSFAFLRLGGHHLHLAQAGVIRAERKRDHHTLGRNFHGLSGCLVAHEAGQHDVGTDGQVGDFIGAFGVGPAADVLAATGYLYSSPGQGFAGNLIQHASPDGKRILGQGWQSK